MDGLLEYRAKLLHCLERQPSELAEAIAAIPEAGWLAHHVSDGSTVHQMVAHVRDLEVLAFLPRVRRILTEAHPTLESFPSHEWSLERYQPTEPMANILRDFAHAREEALGLMRAMSPGDWTRTGFHPPSGHRTAQWWAERMYAHAQEHLNDIRRAA